MIWTSSESALGGDQWATWLQGPAKTGQPVCGGEHVLKILRHGLGAGWTTELPPLFIQFPIVSVLLITFILFSLFQISYI